MRPVCEGMLGRRRGGLLVVEIVDSPTDCTGEGSGEMRWRWKEDDREAIEGEDTGADPSTFAGAGDGAEAVVAGVGDHGERIQADIMLLTRDTSFLAPSFAPSSSSFASSFCG